MVSPLDSTVASMRTKVRRLTGSPSTSTLTDASVDEAINTSYVQDMPSDIKSDLLMEVVEVFTVPNVDRYALSGALNSSTNATLNTGPNEFESIREPVYVEGRRAQFYKSRSQFYNDWPRTASLDTTLAGASVTGFVTAIDVSADPLNEITTADTTGLANGDTVTFDGLGGSTELNGLSFIISGLTATTFDVTAAGVSAFTSGGTWNLQQILTIGAPILQNELMIGGKFGGAQVNYEDDGDPAGTGTGQVVQVGTTTSIGTVVYLTGTITLNLPTPLDSGEVLSVWYYTYSASRPRAVLWWKNELIVRPVPDRGYRIEVEAYKYPTQFTDTTNAPVLNQWWQYLSLLAAMKIMEDRQDMEGVGNLAPLAERQENLIRNRRSNEEIGQRNITIYEGNNQRFDFPFFGGY